jgi:hypothetical protein
MDTLFARFRGPFVAYTAVTYTATKLRDTLSKLRAASDSLKPDAPNNRALHSAIARLSDSLNRVEQREQKARTELGAARVAFVQRSEKLRTDIRQWEDSTYSGWDSIVADLVKTRGLEPVTDTTDATGWARFSLPSGKWWIHARAWDTEDPNSEWYWNLPLTGDTVLLSSRTGKKQPRY